MTHAYHIPSFIKGSIKEGRFHRVMQYVYALPYTSNICKKYSSCSGDEKRLSNKIVRACIANMLEHSYHSVVRQGERTITEQDYFRILGNYEIVHIEYTINEKNIRDVRIKLKERNSTNDIRIVVSATTIFYVTCLHQYKPEKNERNVVDMTDILLHML
jgi:hypothetical protein